MTSLAEVIFCIMSDLRCARLIVRLKERGLNQSYEFGNCDYIERLFKPVCKDDTILGI